MDLRWKNTVIHGNSCDTPEEMLQEEKKENASTTHSTHQRVEFIFEKWLAIAVNAELIYNRGDSQNITELIPLKTLCPRCQEPFIQKGIRNKEKVQSLVVISHITNKFTINNVSTVALYSLSRGKYKHLCTVKWFKGTEFKLAGVKLWPYQQHGFHRSKENISLSTY